VSNIKISIVVPAYNVEDFIGQCLDSCTHQDIPCSDYEIIVVNDGSTDRTLSVVRKYASKYSQVRIVDQINQGLSVARNVGLQEARGEYVWFVDSDDWIENNCLNDIINQCDNLGLDALRVDEVRYKDNQFYRLKIKCLSGLVTGWDSVSDVKAFRLTAWSTIYRRSFLINHSLLFLANVYHEDVEFTPRAYYYLKKLAFLCRTVYYKRYVTTSITALPSIKRSLDLIDVADSLYLFTENVITPSVGVKYQRYHRMISNLALNPAMHNCLQLDKPAKKVFIEKFLKHKYLLKSYLNSDYMPLRIEGMLMKYFQSRCLSVYSILDKVKKCVLIKH